MTEEIEEVRAAAARLMEAFSTGDEDGYFDCFHPDATFLFHGVDPIGSRDEYRTLVRVWKDEHGFRVLSSTSTISSRTTRPLPNVTTLAPSSRRVSTTKPGARRV